MMLLFTRDEQGAVTRAMGVLYRVRFDLERLETSQPGALTTSVFGDLEMTISPTAVPEVTISFTTTPAPVRADPFCTIPWWGWSLAALGAIVIITVLRLVTKR